MSENTKSDLNLKLNNISCIYVLNLIFVIVDGTLITLKPTCYLVYVYSF